jgi:hypothetical protein
VVAPKCSLSRRDCDGAVRVAEQGPTPFAASVRPRRPAAQGQLNQKTQPWWTLSLNELGLALKTSFKLRTSPLKDPRTADQWEPYLAENRETIDRLTRALADAEADLNDRVYALFQLTPDEITLLQREVEH